MKILLVYWLVTGPVVGAVLSYFMNRSHRKRLAELETADIVRLNHMIVLNRKV
jgi:hypothetical protein